LDEDAEEASVTCALPLTADIRASMSVFVPISSASPPGADLPDGVAESPFVNIPLEI
jgi:hypothetical protein